MKQPKIKYVTFFSVVRLGILALLLMCSSRLIAQASTPTDSLGNIDGVKKKPVKNTFESNWIIDDQTVMVPVKGTLEFDIQHRFGIVNNGYSNFYGFFAPPVIRMGFEYVPVNRLQFGFGLCSNNMQLDLNVKYAVLKQEVGGMPVSVTYYGNMVIDTRPKTTFVNEGDRISYFDQIMVARKVTSDLSIQAAISISHFNNVPAYIDADGLINNTVKNDQMTLSFMGRYKISQQMAILFVYDQPLTQNYTNNPHPNISAGIEITTSSHCFQIIAGNGQYILPQNNAMYNMNDYSKGEYLLGFNMTKLWNF